MRNSRSAKSNTGGAFLTPLRYPGGKGRLGPWMAQVMRHNGITGGLYVEPYAGGAGAALYLLTQGCVDHVVINDADPVVYAFWRAATEQPKKLVAKILGTPVTITTWLEQKAIMESPERHDFVDVGFATFFLNRTNRSGILSAGVIGGKSQSGIWKLDARYNAAELSRRILTIGTLAANITVLNLDALDLLTDTAPGLSGNCLVYLDPPYFIKGSLLYRNHYLPGDHAAIAECVRNVDCPVVVTYDDCPEIRRLYDGLDTSAFSLHYSTHTSRTKSTEVMFYKNLNLPFDPYMTRGFQLHQSNLDPIHS